MLRRFFEWTFLLSSIIIAVLGMGGCAAESSEAASQNPVTTAVSEAPAIKITPDSPADTVRTFYRSLREGRFREAIFLTNLRPAIEGLTDTELRELKVDFETLASGVPANLQINGEIISGDRSTVTANIPDDATGKSSVQQIRLKRENDAWIILTVDEAAEAVVKKEGRNYFFKLRIETHEDEARSMLERISKAQIAYSAIRNNGFADIDTLVKEKLLPSDVKTPASTGYNYAVVVAADKKSYFATATPAVYQKTGRLSFVFEAAGRGIPKIVSMDNAGRPLKQ